MSNKSPDSSLPSASPETAPGMNCALRELRKDIAFLEERIPSMRPGIAKDIAQAALLQRRDELQAITAQMGIPND